MTANAWQILGPYHTLPIHVMCNEVLIEAGATLAGAFVYQQLVDELWVYMAPTLMGSRARPLLNLPLDKMSQQIPMTLVESRVVGDDIRFLYQLETE